MRRRVTALIGLLAIALALLVWLAAAPLTSAGDPCYHGFTMPKDTTGSDVQVTLLPCAFSPTTTSVDVGATVGFLNGSEFTHLITGANQSWGSRDVELAPGKTVSYRFDRAGVYPYACALHRGMSGVIVVGDATGSSVGSTSTGSTLVAAPPSPPQDGVNLQAGVIAALSAAVGAIAGATVAAIVLRRRPHDRNDKLAGIA